MKKNIFYFCLFMLLVVIGCTSGDSGSGDLISFTLSPNPLTTTVGQETNMIIIGTRSDSSVVSINAVECTWTIISGQTVFSVSSAGKVKGLSAGSGRVRVTCSGLTRELIVNVN
jgi:hypothetical protein